MKLAILDASVYLHYGSKMIGTRNLNQKGVPTGGLEQLVSNVVMLFVDGYNVSVAFDSHTNRTTAHEGYKGNREPNAKVYIQAKLAYQFLKKTNIPCYKIDGYEADDLIVKFCQDNDKPGNTIAVYTSDMDLAQVVNTRVSLRTPTSLSIDVDRANYERVVVKDKIVHYNSINIYKLMHGDKSDNMKAMKFVTPGFNNQEVYMDMVKLGRSYFKDDLFKIGVPGIPIQWLKNNQSKLDPKDVQEIINRVKIFYPKKVDVNLAYDMKTLNRKALIEFLTIFNFKEAAKLLGEDLASFTKDMDNLLHQIKFEYAEHEEAIRTGRRMVKNDDEIESVGSF